MRFRVAVVVVLALASGCATVAPPACPTYAGPVYRRPFLWKVTGAQGSLVLYATHQAARAEHAISEALTELDRAELFVTEADEFPDDRDFDGRSELEHLFYLPSGTTLQKLLSRDDYRALKRRIDRPVIQLKPWAALMLLTVTAYPFPTAKLSTALVKRAKDRGIPLAFLETWDEQVRYFDEAVTPAKLTAVIRSYPTLPCMMTNRLAAFRAGDDAVFAHEIASAKDPVVARTERWLVRLEPHLASGRRVFVAIGIGQLLGKHGLIARLAERGYTVQRM